MASKLTAPRIFWVMLPAGEIRPRTRSRRCRGLAEPGDIVIDGGNTFYKDDIRRAKALRREGPPLCRRRHLGRRLGARARLLHDDRRPQGGGRPARSDLRRAGARLRHRAAHRGPQCRPTTAPRSGYIHAGPAGSGHFVKMVHNGIEYGLMQAYAEGFDMLKGKSFGQAARGRALRSQPARHRRGLAPRQRGLVVAARSCARSALAKDNMLDEFSGKVADSGEGHWTIEAAMEEAVPAYVLSAALFARYRSRVRHHLRRQAARRRCASASAATSKCRNERGRR